jgi:hypothetical protein
VATEDASHYARLMRNRGLRVEEKHGKQKTLLGGEVDYHTVTGVREGSYRVTLHIEPGPTRVQVVIHASSEEKARKAARKLRDLGFSVDVDEERVSASTRRPTISKLSKAIDAAEEATR